jgi:DNA-binding MarR family transcriptional regulator
MPKQHYKAASYRANDSIGYLVKLAHQLMKDRVEAEFEAQGFTFQQWLVLMYLRDGIATTPAELCRESRHDSGAMTRLIDQLENRGLIERQRSSEDRRVVELRLTSSGRATVESLIPLVVDCLNDALDDFTREEVALLKDLLQRLIGRMRSTNAARIAAAPREGERP